jgi:hypothetical protein
MNVGFRDFSVIQRKFRDKPQQGHDHFIPKPAPFTSYPFHPTSPNLGKWFPVAVQ